MFPVGLEVLFSPLHAAFGGLLTDLCCARLLDGVHHPDSGLRLRVSPGGAAHLHRATGVSHKIHMIENMSFYDDGLLCNTIIVRISYLNEWFTCCNQTSFTGTQSKINVLFLLVFTLVPPRNVCRLLPTSPSWRCSSCTC